MRSAFRRITRWSVLLFHIAAIPVLSAAPLPPGNPIVIVPNGTTISAPGDIVSAYETYVGRWIAGLQPYAADIFWALAGLDFAWLAVETAIVYRLNFTIASMTYLKKFITIGMFLALLNNADQWLPMIANTFPQLGLAASGLSGVVPSDILKNGLTIGSKLLNAAGTSSLTLDFHVGLACLIGAVVIIGCFCYLTAQFVIAKVETIMAIGLGYIFIAFGGSRWTTPYVERYWTYAVASGIKLMAQYMLLGVGAVVANSWVAQVSNLSFWSINADVVFSIMAGTVVYTMLCWYATKLASSVLGGSPSLTNSDALALIGAGLTAGAAASSLLPGVGTATGAAGAAAGKAVGTAAASTGTAAAASAPAAASSTAGGFASSAATVGRVFASAPNAGGGGGSAPRFEINH